VVKGVRRDENRATQTIARARVGRIRGYPKGCIEPHSEHADGVPVG
jgi:hypothetical protein